MGRHKQQIALIGRRLPALHPAGHLALAKGKDFIDIQHKRGVLRHTQAHPVGALGELVVHMIVIRHALVPVFPASVHQHLNLIAVGHGGKADIEAVDWRVLGGLHLHIGLLCFVGIPVRGIFLVGHHGALELAGAEADGALGGNVVRGLRQRGPKRGRREQHEQQQQQPDSPCRERRCVIH